MEIGDTISSVLSFLGAIIFAAGLIKTSDQIEAENKTYFNGNPYTAGDNFKSQPYYRVGILLLLSGFSIDIGYGISRHIYSTENILGVVLSMVFILLGIVLAGLLLYLRSKSHKKLVNSLARKQFLSTLETYRDSWPQSHRNIKDKSTIDHKELIVILKESLRKTTPGMKSTDRERAEVYINALSRQLSYEELMNFMKEDLVFDDK